MRLDLHQRDEAVDLRLARDELGQDSAQTERLLAERRSHPVLARGRRVALVEDQVDHLEDRCQARDPFLPARKLKPDVCFGEGPLGADYALGDRRDRDQERPRDLLGRQAAEDAKGESDPRVLREDRMARHEDEAEEVVADFLFDRRIQVDTFMRALDRASDLFLLALERLAPADQVDRPMLGRSHQPGARLLRHA